MKDTNTAVLIIDDEEFVRDNIAEILSPGKQSAELSSMNEAANILFDEVHEPILAPKNSVIPVFTVDKASNGREGLEKVINSITSDTPYAVIFLDMRMPGWDGLETAMKIREYDSKAEIIFITAYTDRSIEEIVEQAGQNVGYHCKPYASEEIVQLATKAVTDYNRLRNLENLIESIATIGLNERQLNSLLKNILDQLAGTLETDMALLGKLHDNYAYEKVLSIGAIEEKINMEELINRVKGMHIAADEVIQVDELVLARLNCYSVFAVLKNHGKLKTEKMYLLKLFVQNAARAIRNAELHEELVRKEKLSVIGKAIGMVMHDLRSPIKNIGVITRLMREEGQESEWLDMIDKSAAQASEIFDDFTDFIKETPVKKERLALKPLIEESLVYIGPRPGFNSIRMHVDIKDEVFFYGDKSKLRRVIINIVNNAVDALLDFGIADPTVDIYAAVLPAEQEVQLSIRDNGPGIPEDLQKTLFDAFVTKDKANGTGLGLAIVKQYVAAHGGKITVVNNEGAQFDVTLPTTPD